MPATQRPADALRIGKRDCAAIRNSWQALKYDNWHEVLCMNNPDSNDYPELSRFLTVPDNESQFDITAESMQELIGYSFCEYVKSLKLFVLAEFVSTSNEFWNRSLLYNAAYCAALSILKIFGITSWKCGTKSRDIQVDLFFYDTYDRVTALPENGLWYVRERPYTQKEVWGNLRVLLDVLGGGELPIVHTLRRFKTADHSKVASVRSSLQYSSSYYGKVYSELEAETLNNYFERLAERRIEYRYLDDYSTTVLFMLTVLRMLTDVWMWLGLVGAGSPYSPNELLVDEERGIDLTALLRLEIAS